MFKSKDEPLEIIAACLQVPKSKVKHVRTFDQHMFVVEGSPSKLPTARHALSMLRVIDREAGMRHAAKDSSFTFITHVTKTDLIVPKDVLSVLSSALVIFAGKVKQQDTLVFDRSTEGRVKFTLPMAVSRQDVEFNARALEAYFEHYGIEADVLVVEMRKRPPFMLHSAVNVVVIIKVQADGASVTHNNSEQVYAA